MLAVELGLVSLRGYAAVIFLSKQCSIQISCGMTLASRNVRRRQGAVRDFTADLDALKGDPERASEEQRRGGLSGPYSGGGRLVSN